MANKKLTKTEIKALESGVIPPDTWYQFADWFTNQDELLKALLESNLRLEALLSGTEPPIYLPSPPIEVIFPESVDIIIKNEKISLIDYGRVNIKTNPTLILSPNPGRMSCLLQNLGNTEVYIGFNDELTTDNGINLVRGQVWWRDSYVGAVYAITETGTSSIRYEEGS